MQQNLISNSQTYEDVEKKIFYCTLVSLNKEGVKKLFRQVVIYDSLVVTEANFDDWMRQGFVSIFVNFRWDS